jgi:hypothetical protein
MQINKCLSFKQIMFLNISLNNIFFLIKYKKYNLKNVYIKYYCDKYLYFCVKNKHSTTKPHILKWLVTNNNNGNQRCTIIDSD